MELIHGPQSSGNTPPYPDSPVPEVRQKSPFRSTFRSKVCKQPVKILELRFPCYKNSLYTKYFDPKVNYQTDFSKQLSVEVAKWSVGRYFVLWPRGLALFDKRSRKCGYTEITLSQGMNFKTNTNPRLNPDRALRDWYISVRGHGDLFHELFTP